MSKPVFKDLFTFSGRRNRKSYILYGVAVAVISVVASMIIGGLMSGADADMSDVESGVGTGAMIAMILSGVLGVAVFVSGIAVGAQRCRDLEWTGWYLLLYCVPFVNVYLVFRLIFVPGTNGDNRYGPDPLAS